MFSDTSLNDQALNVGGLNSSEAAQLQLYNWQGLLQEAVAEYDFEVRALDWVTSALLGVSPVVDGAYQINGPVDAVHYALLLALPKGVTPWEAGKVYATNALVFPPNPVTISRFYKAVAGGVSGTQAPLFPSDGGTVVDNGATWQDLGVMVRTLSHGPVPANA